MDKENELSSLRYDAPIRVYDRLCESLGIFKDVVIPKTGDYFNAQAYHDNLESALKTLKQISAEIMDSGRMVGFRQLSVLHDVLEEAEKNKRDTEPNEIFWSLLSDYFPIEKQYGISHKGLSNGLRVKLLAQMVEGDEDPGRLASVELNDLHEDAFMEGLTTVLRLVQPPERPFCTSHYELLNTLKRRLNDSAFIPTAAEHIAAHQALYFPFFEHILNLVTNPPTIATKNIQKGSAEQYALDHTIDMQKTLLLKMGFFENKVNEIEKKSSSFGTRMANVELDSMRSALALPPELLMALDQMTHAPLIRQMADVSCDKPSGRSPFLYLEQMGVVRTADWHLQAQESSTLGHATCLYEHAILTPGIELSLRSTVTQLLTASIESIKGLISMMERIPASDPECRRKGQQLFDVLVENMSTELSSPLLVELLQSCRIDRAFYGKHKTLKGRRLEDELGM